MKLNPWLKESTNSGNKVCFPGKALNVSYSEDGLKWTLNNYGKLLYYKSTKLSMRDKDGRMMYVPVFKGDMVKSNRVFVEPFVPRDHIIGGKINKTSQKVEYFWCNKAQRLLYVST